MAKRKTGRAATRKAKRPQDVTANDLAGVYVGARVRLLVKAESNSSRRTFFKGTIMQVRAAHEGQLILQRVDGGRGMCNVHPDYVNVID